MLLTRALRECKLCQGQSVIWDSNLDFQINPALDPDICQVSQKSASDSVCEMLINVLEMEKRNLESIIRDQITSNS